jgi:hypothetical protein
MREVFKPELVEAQQPVYGVFYTITATDVGKSAPLMTTVGFIPINEVMGRVLPGDVGKRIYAHLSDDSTHTVWQVDNS